ncbi:MAG: M20 family peptidase, partial [Synergistaceae bacterium]|nr:M20 family peptidase [Synergistaceae bacterium]
MDNNKFIQRLYSEIDKQWLEMAEMSDAFAAEPEISGAEFKTSKKIVDVLKKAGFDVEYPFIGLPTAFFAKKGKPGSGGKVALLVEYDALPEIGHACG